MIEAHERIECRTASTAAASNFLRQCLQKHNNATNGTEGISIAWRSLVLPIQGSFDL